jgi:hypothetical protein
MRSLGYTGAVRHVLGASTSDNAWKQQVSRRPGAKTAAFA